MAQTMDRGFLSGNSNLFVKQTRKGCFQEMMGCEANTEFKIATLDAKKTDIYYATEDTTCCMRFFCTNNRPWTITVSDGGSKGGKVLATAERPFRCPLGPCKCCCLQEVVVKDGGGALTGSLTEDCWVCVPSLKMKDAAGAHKYNFVQPTCCGGMCVNVCAEGCCPCRIPFYIFPPGQSTKGQEKGRVVKVFGGLATELFTDADKFEVLFPDGEDSATKTTLLGGVFLLNQLFFESDKESAGGGCSLLSMIF
mmetsp:Transcript_29307/g.66496  ORF Transcript_29307/g.66496 Transcript_29307/m.66496 type:complete len:252 (+) Transcript_29307:56-811(+)